jgi:hypothetical protein
MSNVAINIAAEFTGKKAFKQAETSTEKLGKGVKRLAGALGLAFSTRAIVNFGRLAVKASLDQQAEQNRLNQLLKVGVGATTQEIALLNDQAKVLEKIGVVSGGNITQTQSQLATFNLQVSTIEALTPAILDYVTAEKGATASTADFKSMTNGLAQALNGNFASLTRVGFVLDENTKKQIANGTEAEKADALVKVLNSTYKDFNKNLRATDAGQMQVLSNAAQDATAIIGTGLLDALKGLGKDGSVDNLAQKMQDTAVYTADVIRGIGVLVGMFSRLSSVLDFGFALEMGNKFSILGLLNALAPDSKSAAIQKSTDNAHLKSLQNQFKLSTKIVNNAKKLTAEELKQLKTKKLQQAIDKANLALNKGEEVFDMDKIQIAAALTSQAEQLGKATSSAQQLQIANDIARLTVKQSILALEDAIAAKDEQAIIAATNKLNADLKVLNVLSGQNVKLADIKSILDSLKPKDLINQANLDAALAKIREMMALLAQANTQATAKIPTSGSLGSGITVGDYIAPIDTKGGSIAAILEYAEAASARADAFAILMEQQNYADYLDLIDYQKVVGDFGGYSPYMNTGGSQTPVVNVYANTIANPDELTNLIQNSIIQLNKRGDYLTTAGAL